MRALAPEVRFYNLPMSIPTRSVGTGTYFVTTATFNRRRLFQVTANAELFLETLQLYRRKGHYKLHAFVVMPDHVHLLLTPQSLSIERVVGFIKGGFSHRLGSNFPVWQRGFTDHRIRDSDEFYARREYIHQNPVRARMVESPELYCYSSAYAPKGEKRTSAAEAE
jgi:putative transposase